MLETEILLISYLCNECKTCDLVGLMLWHHHRWTWHFHRRYELSDSQQEQKAKNQHKWHCVLSLQNVQWNVWKTITKCLFMITF